MGYNHKIDKIKNGEVVAAGTPNRPLEQLNQNVSYLYDLVQSTRLGQALYALQVTVESSVKVGMPVYYNSSTQRWEKALAAVETVDGTVQPAKTAGVWGIVKEKSNATLADILLAGYDEIDISEAVDGDVETGLYYLSAATAGMMINQRPPVSIPVLRATSDGYVLVLAQWRDMLTEHVHYKFELETIPAGDHTPPSVGQRHEITNADSDIEGWLPADHAVFDGKAPAGAVFGYNIKANTALNNAWPPLPVDNAYLELDRGGDKSEGFEGVPLGSSGLALLDTNGIWWMSDCYDDVPWDKDYDGSPEVVDESDSAECPRNLYRRMQLWFTKPTFMTDLNVVTSLTSKDDRLTVTCQDGSGTASVGDLQLKLDLSFLVNGTDSSSAFAIKEFNSATQTFKKGPVVGGVYAQSSRISLTSSEATSKLVPGDDTSADVHKGNVGIDVSESLDRELLPDRIRLDGATEEFYEDVMYIGFGQSSESSIRVLMRVPTTTDLTDPQLKLRFRLLGRVSGTLPAMTLTARKLSAPSALESDEVALVTSDTSLTLNTAFAISSANNYIEVESEALDVDAGDDVLFTLTRSGSDGYSGQVGLLRQVGLLSASPSSDSA